MTGATIPPPSHHTATQPATLPTELRPKHLSTVTEATLDQISRDFDWELEVLAYPLQFDDEPEIDSESGTAIDQRRSPAPSPTPYSATEAVINSQCQIDSGIWLRG